MNLKVQDFRLLIATHIASIGKKTTNQHKGGLDVAIARRYRKYTDTKHVSKKAKLIVQLSCISLTNDAKYHPILSLYKKAA